ncbi:hypothetical protein DERP_012991 [Dermatophagoides pteronyssinus]|uniref:Uncharacterized protein n=1 Tax=Dermatophagoides pteronyssinus TaxID=6956 RepID=A0ABQ8IT90_DERPT|nr:hypothetical protein DERP_012991 [Dermatophagoides pteronyssinus]
MSLKSNTTQEKMKDEDKCWIVFYYPNALFNLSLDFSYMYKYRASTLKSTKIEILVGLIGNCFGCLPPFLRSHI